MRDDVVLKGIISKRLLDDLNDSINEILQSNSSVKISKIEQFSNGMVLITLKGAKHKELRLDHKVNTTTHNVGRFEAVPW